MGENPGPFQPGFADIHTVYIMHLNILSLKNPDQHVFSNKGPEEAMCPAGRFGGLKFPQRGARAVVQISTEMGLSAMPICHLWSQTGMVPICFKATFFALQLPLCLINSLLGTVQGRRAELV